MPSAPDNPTRPERRRRSIRLPRPLWIGLAAVLLIALAVGLFVGGPTYRQHVAICEIERVGGSVTMRPRGPEWLRDRIGSEGIKIVDPPVFVHLMDSIADDATLVHLAAIGTLESVGLNNTEVTDAGLVHVKSLGRLEVLRLDGTKVTDEGLVHLKKLSSLAEFWLHGTRVTDAGVVDLKAAFPGIKIEK